MNATVTAKPSDKPQLPAAPALPTTLAEFEAAYDAANPHPYPGLAPLSGVVTVGGRSRTMFPGAGVIELRQAENPKKYGTATFYRYRLYRTGATIDEHIEAISKLEGTRLQDARSQGLRDVNWDTEAHRGFIAVWPAGTTADQITAVRAYTTARDAAVAQYKAAAALRPAQK